MIKNKGLIFIVVMINCINYFILGQCPLGYFKIYPMKFCHPWLSCSNINEINVKQLIGFGSTKSVHLAEWKNFNVSYSSLRNKYTKYDFYQGLHVLKTLKQNEYINQLVGFCESLDVIITEYQENNNALNFYSLKETVNTKVKFDLCINYVEIINYLHNSPLGVLVNCDSNDLDKLLSQILITKQFKIVLGDVDALPQVNANSTIKCGMREIRSSFAAPEQLWWKAGPFNFKDMNGYDEKTDIWKIPDVCNFFLQGPDFELIQYRLFGMHKICKDHNPENRPTTKCLIDFYKNVRDSFL